MRQTTLAEGSFAKYKKPTRKEEFIAQMGEMLPWKDLSEVIEPHYAKPKGSGRRPIGIESMLRIHCMQHWFNLSDPGMEESLYDIAVLREFAHIDLGRETAPDETTICMFRHIQEENNLGEPLFHLLNDEKRSKNRCKSNVRAKVEHIFHVMKRQFGFRKVRYRGFDKNANWVFMQCALINLVMSNNKLPGFP